MSISAKPSKAIEAPTSRLAEAMARLSELPPKRQDEIARMVLDLLEGEKQSLRLSLEQQAEVEAAMKEDGPYASDEEMAAFFSKYRQ